MGDAQRAALRDWVAMLRRRWDEANPQARGLAPALPREASADAGGRDQEADPDGNLIFPFWRAVCELDAAAAAALRVDMAGGETCLCCFASSALNRLR